MRPVARKIGAGLLALAYLVVFGEAYLRLFGSRFIGEPGHSYIRPPYHDSTAYGVRFRTNRWGLRGSDFSPGALRVVTFGGSATESVELPEEASWPGQLERAFNAVAGGRVAEVANAGMAGTASAHYLAHLRELGGPVGIDAAVIFTGINDADRLARYGEILGVTGLESASYGEAFFQAFSRPDPTRFAELPVPFLLQHSRFYLFLKGFGVKALGQPLRNSLEDRLPGRSLRDKRERLRASPDYRAILERAVDDYGRNLSLMIRAARGMGITPIFVTMPIWSEEEDPELPPLNARLIEVCRREGVPYVDLASHPLPPGESWFGQVGHHLGREGAERAGRIIAARLAELLYGEGESGETLRGRAAARGIEAGRRARLSGGSRRLVYLDLHAVDVVDAAAVEAEGEGGGREGRRQEGEAKEGQRDGGNEEIGVRPMEIKR